MFKKIVAILMVTVIALMVSVFPAAAASGTTYPKNSGKKINYTFSLKEEKNDVTIEIGNLKNLEGYVNYMLSLDGHFITYIILDDGTYFFSEFYLSSENTFITWREFVDKDGKTIDYSYDSDFDFKNEKLVIKCKSDLGLVKGLKKSKSYKVNILGAYANNSGALSYIYFCDDPAQEFGGTSNEKSAASDSKSTKPSAPKNVKAKKVSDGKAKFSWDKVSGADGYVVYMASAKDGTYNKIKTVSKASTVSVTKSGLTKGKTYYFKVRAYKVVDGKKVYSKYSSIKSVKV